MSENLNEIEAPACPECSENYTYEMGELWACPMCGHEWERTAAGETEEEAGSKVLDSVGNELVDGDSVTIVKGLKVGETAYAVIKASNVMVGADH